MKYIYIQDTGKYTILIIEGGRRDSNEYKFDFYKQTFYPHYKNNITIYGEQMDASQLLERVERHLYNRK